jgi:hypothetical protein
VSRVTIQIAANSARQEFLGQRGVTGVSYVGDTIVIYLESAEYVNLVPQTYMGYRVVYKITGRIGIL